MNNNKVARIIYEAKKNSKNIKANIRLAKNGRFSSVNGQVEDLKVSRDGFPYVVIKKGNSYQNVRLNNVLSVTANGKTYKNS